MDETPADESTDAAEPDAPVASDAPAGDATDSDDAAADETETAAPEDDAPPALTEEQEALLARLEAELGDGLVEHTDVFGTLTVRVRPDAWRRTAEVAKSALECDYLSFIAGIDWQPAPKEAEEDSGDTSTPAQPDEMTFGAAGSEGRFQVFAHVQSTRRHWGVTVKTDVDESTPSAQSWVDVYPGADWHERECWEMYGIDFPGHPHLRKLFLPAEFEGNPLRKDYPLLARVVKPWPGLVDVEPMPEEEGGDDGDE